MKDNFITLIQFTILGFPESEQELVKYVADNKGLHNSQMHILRQEDKAIRRRAEKDVKDLIDFVYERVRIHDFRNAVNVLIPTTVDGKKDFKAFFDARVNNTLPEV